MKTFLKVLAVLFGISMIVTGFYCLFHPALTYLSVGFLVGLSMLFDAAGSFTIWGEKRQEGIKDTWSLVGGIFSVVFGCIILGSWGMQIGLDVFLVYYFAIWIVIRGIAVIVRSFKARRLHKNLDTVILGASWYVALILGILLVAYGVLSLYKPLVLAATIGVFMGIGIIFAGANIITQATTPAE